MGIQLLLTLEFLLRKSLEPWLALVSVLTDQPQEPVAPLAIVCQTSKFVFGSKACSPGPIHRSKNALALRIAKEDTPIVVHGVNIKEPTLRTRMQTAGRTIMAARQMKAATFNRLLFCPSVPKLIEQLEVRLKEKKKKIAMCIYIYMCVRMILNNKC